MDSELSSSSLELLRYIGVLMAVAGSELHFEQSLLGQIKDRGQNGRIDRNPASHRHASIVCDPSSLQ